MKIISAGERLAEKRGAKILIVGPPGVGKTSLLRTLDVTSVLFLDVEAGDLAVQDVPVDTIRIDTWAMARDLACRIGGPNPSFPPTACYSQAHYEAVGSALENIERYKIIFVDSITEISRLSFRHAEQQPEASTARGTKDLRGIYGLHAREMLMWLHQLQHTREKDVVFIGILEKVLDDFNRFVEFRLQVEGQRVPREISGIIDEYVVMNFLDFGDGKLTRAFVCSSPNRWGLSLAKDRSGKLDQVEEPHLGKLIAKLIPGPDSPAKAISQGGPSHGL